MIPNDDLIRAKESVAKRKIHAPTGAEGVRIPVGQRMVEKMVPMIAIVRDLKETPLSDWKLEIS